jgi:hypothetical protein
MDERYEEQQGTGSGLALEILKHAPGVTGPTAEQLQVYGLISNEINVRNAALTDTLSELQMLLLHFHTTNCRTGLQPAFCSAETCRRISRRIAASILLAQATDLQGPAPEKSWQEV